jgi:hypothetical protein
MPGMRPLLRPARWVAALLLLSSVAQAQPSGDPRVSSRASFERGAKAFENGRIQEALTLFEDAYKAYPHYATYYNIGLCERALGHPVRAAAAFKSFLEGGGAKVPAAQKKSVRALLDEVTKKVATLQLTVSPEGAKITLDGESTKPGTLSIDPGEHVLEASRDGFADARRKFQIAPGGTVLVDLALPPIAAAPAETPAPPVAAPPAPPPAPAERPFSTGFYVTASLAGLGLVAGGVTGLLALSDASAYNDPATSDQDADRHLSRGKTLRVASDVSFGVALVSGVAAVLLGVRDKASGRGDGAGSTGWFRVEPRLAPGQGGLWAAGRF